MSLVTNLILTAHVGLTRGSDHEIDSVNKFHRETEDSHGQFVDVSENAGARSIWNVACTSQHLIKLRLKSSCVRLIRHHGETRK